MGVMVTVANVVVVATPAFCNAYFNIYTSLIILTNIPLKYKKEPYVNKIYYIELYINFLHSYLYNLNQKCYH